MVFNCFELALDLKDLTAYGKTKLFKHKHTFKHCMATKTLTITENAYKSLIRIKAEDESFSHLFIRITKSNLLIKDLQGKLKGISDVQDLRRRIATFRIKFDKEAKERYASLG